MNSRLLANNTAASDKLYISVCFMLRLKVGPKGATFMTFI